MRQLSKFLHLPPHEKGLLIRVWILLGVIRLGLGLLPFLTLKGLLTKVGPVLVGSGQKSSVDRLAWTVGVASRFVPKATCLAQALAMHVLLQQAGHQAFLHIGVTNSEEGNLKAHAWVESHGRILIGGLDLSSYTPLLTME
mgnify:CR=1 FL=1